MIVKDDSDEVMSETASQKYSQVGKGRLANQVTWTNQHQNQH